MRRTSKALSFTIQVVRQLTYISIRITRNGAKNFVVEKRYASSTQFVFPGAGENGYISDIRWQLEKIENEIRNLL